MASKAPHCPTASSIIIAFSLLSPPPFLPLTFLPSLCSPPWALEGLRCANCLWFLYLWLHLPGILIPTCLHTLFLSGTVFHFSLLATHLPVIMLRFLWTLKNEQISLFLFLFLPFLFPPQPFSLSHTHIPLETLFGNYWVIYLSPPTGLQADRSPVWVIIVSLLPTKEPGLYKELSICGINEQMHKWSQLLETRRLLHSGGYVNIKIGHQVKWQKSQKSPQKLQVAKASFSPKVTSWLADFAQVGFGGSWVPAVGSSHWNPWA